MKAPVVIDEKFEREAREGAKRRETLARERGRTSRPADAPDMSILRRNAAPAAPFPLDILGAAGTWVERMAESKAAPADYVALSVLVAAAAAIGAKRRVSPWVEWEEASILWGVLVGDPSSGKSPAMDPVRDAVREIERYLNSDWADRQAEHATAREAASYRRDAWKKELEQAVGGGRTPPTMPSDAAAPKAPTRRRIWEVDTSTEQIARILGENAAGLLVPRDELAGLLGGFDRYGGSGSDRAFWLEAYGGRSYRYDRVGLKGEAIDIPYCAISLLGGTQPDRLDAMLLSGIDDGLAARPLYAWPDPVPRQRPTRVADPLMLQAALRRLYDLPWDGPVESPRARVVTLTPDATFEFQSWWEFSQWDAGAGPIAGAIGKLPGVTLRVAQALEYLTWAWSGSNGPEPGHITLDSVQGALRMVEEWVRPTLSRVFAEAQLPAAQRDARTVALWMLKARPTHMNVRDLTRRPGFDGPRDSKRLTEALDVLVHARWLHKPEQERSPKGGRPRGDYLVNALVYEAVRG